VQFTRDMFAIAKFLFTFNFAVSYRFAAVAPSLLHRLEQEFSYCKQIARQLRTQYVKDINRPKYYTMTLKSRLKVTHGHWKRNRWTDHTQLTISRVILR